MISELRAQRMSSGEPGKERKRSSCSPKTTSKWRTPAPTWHLWLLTSHWPCPVPCVLIAPQPRLRHLFPFLSVSDLGLGHFLPHFTHTGASSSQDPSPAGYRDKWWQLFSSQGIRKLFFPNRILFCSQDSNSSSLRGVCTWYGQWCCAGNYF